MKGPTYLSYAGRSFACESCGNTRTAPENGRTRELAEAIAAFEADHAHCSGWDERPAGRVYNDRPDLEARLAQAAILAAAVRRLDRLRNPPQGGTSRDRYQNIHAQITHAQEAVRVALAEWDRLPRTARLAALERQATLLERCASASVREAVVFASMFCSDQQLGLAVQARLASLLSGVLLDVRYEGQEAAVRARVAAIFERSAPGFQPPLPEIPSGTAFDVAAGDWLVIVPTKTKAKAVTRCRSEDELEAMLARVDHLKATAVLVAHAAVRP